MLKIVFVCFGLSVLTVSGCVSRGGGRTAPARMPQKNAPREKKTPHRNEKVPPPPEKILGKGRLDSRALSNFLLCTNPLVEKSLADNLAEIYIEEAEIEGVNHDVAFSQMCLETGFLSFGGQVTPDMNNFCGLGTTGEGIKGASFPNPRLGVRAQIQHLKLYATEAPLKQENVDPRRRFVRPGSAPTIEGLSGSWAEDRDYAKKIRMILNRLYETSFGS